MEEDKRIRQLEQRRSYYERTKEKRRAYQREYARTHPRKELSKKEREELNAFRRMKYKANAEHFREYKRNYDKRKRQQSAASERAEGADDGGDKAISA